MNFIPFGEWLKENGGDFMVATVQCPDCKGTGMQTCRCCFNESDCDSCNGTGQIIDDSGKLHLDENAASVAYENAKKRDAELIEKWVKAWG